MWQEQMTIYHGDNYSSAMAHVSMLAGLSTIFLAYYAKPIEKYIGVKNIPFIMPVIFSLVITLLLLFQFNPLNYSYAIYFMCLTGGMVEVVLRPLKYAIVDLFTSKMWDDNQVREYQPTVNMVANRPVRLIAFLLIFFLALLFSASGTVSDVAWLLPIIVLPVIYFWFSAASKISDIGNPDPKKTDEEKSDTQSNNNTSSIVPVKKRFTIMSVICIFLMAATVFLNAVKNKISSSCFPIISIPGIKLFSMLVSTFLYFINKACTKKSQAKSISFDLVVVSYIIFALAFIFILYPNVSYLHAMLAYSSSFFPLSIGVILNNWVYVLFYISADMWNIVTFELLYYPLQNQAFTDQNDRSEISTYFPQLTIVAAFSQVLFNFIANFIIRIPFSFEVHISLFLSIFMTLAFTVMCVHNCFSNTLTHQLQDDSDASSKDTLGINTVFLGINKLFNSLYMLSPINNFNYH